MNGEIKGWVLNEFGTLDLNSRRLERRFHIAMSDLSDQPDASIWLASGSRNNAKAVYRMLANENFDKDSILAAHRDTVSARGGEYQVLLAVQDTMSVNYGSHAKTEGMGYNCEQTLGFNVHSCLLLTPDGIPLGLLGQSTVTREESSSRELSREEKRARPIEDKESFRWLETMRAAASNAPERATLVHIADREGDIYELIALAQQLEEKFVIRATQDRLDSDNSHAMQTLRESMPVGKTTLTVQANHKKNTAEREALLTIQYQYFNINRPKTRKNDPSIEPSVGLTLLRLAEESPPEGAEPIEWILMTNLVVGNAYDALRIAGYYRQRWKIERFHFVLKSGCKIEKIQQRSAGRVELMILMYSIIAVHIMQLTFLSRNAPDTPCDLIFSEIEWKTLHRAANRTKTDAERPPPMAEAVRLVAKLGGFDGAKSDGAPGLKVIWIGLSKLFLLVAYREFL